MDGKKQEVEGQKYTFLISRDEVAKRLGVVNTTVDRLAVAGRIRKYKIGHAARFDAAEIQAFIEASIVGGAQ